jgi:hypothetical protein
MLVQTAWLILRSRAKDDPLFQWADRIATTRGKKIAATALARKLAGVLWAMWRDGKVYDPVAQATSSAKGKRRDARARGAQADALERAAKKLARRAPRQTQTSEVAMS